MIAKASAKGNHGALGGGIIQQLWVAHCEVDARIEDDCGLAFFGLFEFRDRGLGEIEERVNVGVKRCVPLLRRKFDDIGVSPLGSVVEDEGVQFSVEFNVLRHERLTGRFGGEVKRNEKQFTRIGCLGMNCFFDVFSLFFFLRKVGQSQVCSLKS